MRFVLAGILGLLFFENLYASVLMSKQPYPIAKPLYVETKGEDLFRSIFFGVGKRTNSISPDFRPDTALKTLFESKSHMQNFRVKNFEELMLKVEEGSELIVNRILIEDPEFFNKFEYKITSGDPRLVEQAVLESRAKIKEIGQKINQSNDTDSMDIIDPIGSCVAVTVVVFEFGAVVAAAAVVSVVVVYLDDYKENNLHFELAIADYTRAFAKA